MAGQVVNRFNIIPNRLLRAISIGANPPKKPWQVPPNPVFWHLDWIEVFSADVTKVLCSGQQPRINKVNLTLGAMASVTSRLGRGVRTKSSSSAKIKSDAGMDQFLKSQSGARN